MECPRCGEVIGNESRFCSRCGYGLYDTNSATTSSENQVSVLKIITVFIIVLCLIGGIMFTYINRDNVLSAFGLEDESIKIVKDGTPNDYPNITYGEAFGNFFSNGEWDHFESEDGDDIVGFTGNCLFAGEEVTVYIQFTIDDNKENFECTYLSLNDVPQSYLIIYALLLDVFESY